MKWEQVQLIEAAEINPGLPKRLVPGSSDPVTFLPMAAVGEDGSIDTSETRPYGDVAKGYTAFCKGDVLLAKITPCMENGKATLVNGSSTKVGCGSTEFHVLRAREGFYPRYLFHLIWNEPFRRLAARNMTGSAGQKRVPKSFLETHSIPIPHKNGKPDLDEQKRIAAILDKADAIRRKRQQALRLTDDFLRSVFLDMFGDPFPNPKGWDTTTVGDELEFLTSGSRGWAKYYSEEGDFFIRIQNLRGGFLDISDSAFVNAPESAEARRTRVQPGDLLLSITADLGRTAVVPEGFGKGHINQHLAILRLKEMNPVFVSQQMASPGGQRQFVSLNRSAVKAGLNFDDIRSIKLLRPPLPLQNDFSRIVAKLENRTSKLVAASAESDDLFASLQQRAFRGEL